MKEYIYAQTKAVMEEMGEKANLQKGNIFVVGCSTSEVAGDKIGTNSSPEIAAEIFRALYDYTTANGLHLAVQCCEHLNRALIVERECAEKYGLEEVCVLPQPKAGGSFATAAWAAMQQPCAVESIRAHMGIDIGGTLIGMHLRAVAVPVRLSVSKIGEANILCARTRPKYIGGARAQYPDN